MCITNTTRRQCAVADTDYGLQAVSGTFRRSSANAGQTLPENKRQVLPAANTLGDAQLQTERATDSQAGMLNRQ